MNLKSCPSSNDQTLEHVVWLSIRDASRRYSISRSKLYDLLAEGKIKSCVLRRRDALRGKRLLSAESINALLENLATGVPDGKEAAP